LDTLFDFNHQKLVELEYIFISFLKFRLIFKFIKKPLVDKSRRPFNQVQIEHLIFRLILFELFNLNRIILNSFFSVIRIILNELAIFHKQFSTYYLTIYCLVNYPNYLSTVINVINLAVIHAKLHKFFIKFIEICT